jgi:tripartite ATP-independent transporter DctM subunit
MEIKLYCGLVIVLMLTGFPVTLSFFLPSIGYILLTGMSLDIILKQVVSGISSFVYIAVPMFILSAQAMNEGETSERMFKFCDKLVGHIRGGLSHVNIVTSIIFAGMSGSAIADTTGIGFMCYRAMVKRGFDKAFSAALTISSATVGPIIPPSIIMVMYAVIADASVGKLFIGGIVPGLIIGGSLMIYCIAVADKFHFPREPRPTLVEFLKSFQAAILPLITPIILIGGIYSGVFTPTESAAASAAYALLLLLYYSFRKKENPLKYFAKLALDTTKMCGMTMYIIACASVFSWIITRENIPQLFTNALVSFNISRTRFLVMVNIVFLLLGCAFDSNTILLVFVPIIMPTVKLLGINTVHFGILVTINLMIGMMTPPFGMQLFVVSGLTKIPIGDILKKLWPMILIIIGTLILVTYIEPLSMWLPNMMLE